MRNSAQKLNHRISLRIYRQYLLKAFLKPFLIALIVFISVILLGKSLFFDLPNWYVLCAGLTSFLVIVFQWFVVKKSFFTYNELLAYIDAKGSAGGQYMAAHDRGLEVSPTLLTELNEKFKLNTDASWLGSSLLYLLGIIFVLLLISFLPKTFMNVIEPVGHLLENEKKLLEKMLDSKVVSTEFAKEMQKEIEQLKKEISEKGVDKNNWDKKNEISQMLADQFLEQAHLQERIKDQLGALEKKIGENTTKESLMKALHDLENDLALNNFAKSNENIAKGQEGLKDILNGLKLDELQKLSRPDQLNALKELQKLSEEMLKQLKERQACQACQSPGGDKNAGKPKDGGGSAQEKNEKGLEQGLQQLVQGLERSSQECEQAILLMENGIGVSRGPGPAELNYTNQTKESFEPLNIEQLSNKKKFNKKGETVDILVGEHEKYILDKATNAKRSFSDTGIEMINGQRVVPNRRSVIKKYFDRDSKEGE